MALTGLTVLRNKTSSAFRLPPKRKIQQARNFHDELRSIGTAVAESAAAESEAPRAPVADAAPAVVVELAAVGLAALLAVAIAA